MSCESDRLFLIRHNLKKKKKYWKVFLLLQNIKCVHAGESLFWFFHVQIVETTSHVSSFSLWNAELGAFLHFNSQRAESLWVLGSMEDKKRLLRILLETFFDK